MDFEQILIRLGLDAKALTSGLTRTTSFVKGWAIGLLEDLKNTAVGRLAGLYIFERLFDSIKEKALFVRRTAQETGLSTNMVQSMANELGYVGERFEGLSKPLNKFNELIGEAKQGSIEARQKLLDLGIVTRAEEINSLNLTKGLIALNAQFHRINDPAVFAAQLRQIGKGMEELTPILQLNERRFAQMNRPNFFTKISPATLEAGQQTASGAMGAWNSVSATVANIFGFLVRWPHQAKDFGKFLNEGPKTALERMQFMLGMIQLKEKENAQVAQETTEAYQKRKEITEEIQKLENQIGDRTKLTVDQLDERYRQITGDRSPRGLERIHAITPAIASAHAIKTLELEADAATASNQFDRAGELSSRAAQLRASNLALKSTEREPTKLLEQHLEALKLTHQALTTDGITVKEIKPQNH